MAPGLVETTRALRHDRVSVTESDSSRFSPETAPRVRQETPTKSPASLLAYETPAHLSLESFEKPDPWTAPLLAIPGAAMLLGKLIGVPLARGGLDCFGLCCGLLACLVVIPSVVVAGNRPSLITIGAALVNVLAVALICRMVWQLMHQSWI